MDTLAYDIALNPLAWLLLIVLIVWAVRRARA